MAYTGAQIVALTREVMDAVSSTEWSEATLTAWTGMAQWQLWANLLNANRYLNMQQVTVTQDANGQFNVSDLTTGTADTTKHFYRILSLAQPAGQTAQVQYFYRQSRYEDFPNPQPNTSLPYVWYRFGSKIQVLPVSAGQQQTVTVNYRPPSIAQLSALSVNITFPDGYEPLIAWRASQMALLKGGNETQASLDLQRKADVMEHQMLQDLGRESRWPIVAEAFDTAGDWGGGSIG